ncbi:amidohydrolase [Kribbella antibiotica]|uniref:Amidohydrolase n=1 Tax=Kribbella antibiotica TaxID=190195 RepID=A0A4R4ZVA1_9ACTN|nr:amidohydrolase family protein [Kribbella antibiotica]TDD63093.1 amidohydrolase [Kribbella antibiotica]
MRTLVQGGLVIDTAPEVTVRRGVDVLIEDGRIAAVGAGLPADGASVIDARGRIVLPGFVDTHRHVWQTALRGIGTEGDLGFYFDHVMQARGTRYRPEDVAVSNLVGALECLDGGITTVQDYSHVQGSAVFAEAAVDALDRSGIRAVYGFGPSPLVGGMVDSAALHHVADLASPRITIALASTGPAYAPFDVVQADWALAAELGLSVVTHIDRSGVTQTPIALLAEAGLLRASTLYVHCNNLSDSELKLIADSGASVSITPAVESRLEMGPAVAARLKSLGVPFALGIDTVTSAPGDMFSIMRQVLALGYGSFTASEVLRLATVAGAQALSLPSVGSLAVGNHADLMLLRASDVNLAGGLVDPVATVVSSAHPGNVETVLVGGAVVKRDGHLVTAPPVDAFASSIAHLFV